MFDEDARDALICHLGYIQTPLESSQDESAQEVSAQEEAKPVEEPVIAPTITAEDLFSNASPLNGISPVAAMSPTEEESPVKPEEKMPKEETPEEWERAVKDRVIVGDFGGAVEVCFKYQRFADALVISTWGGAELAERTTVHVRYNNYP